MILLMSLLAFILGSVLGAFLMWLRLSVGIVGGALDETDDARTAPPDVFTQSLIRDVAASLDMSYEEFCNRRIIACTDENIVARHRSLITGLGVLTPSLYLAAHYDETLVAFIELYDEETPVEIDTWYDVQFSFAKVNDEFIITEVRCAMAPDAYQKAKI